MTSPLNAFPHTPLAHPLTGFTLKGGKWLGPWLILCAMACSASASTLAVYTFINSPPGKTNLFAPDLGASGLTASILTMHAMGTDGVVTNFHGATDTIGYSNYFDGKGFEAPASALTANGTEPEPTNSYAEFTLVPWFGYALTITGVQIDYGFDTSLDNAADTRPHYDLYLSLDGTNFIRMGTTSSSITAQTNSYTITNNLGKAVAGFSGVTNPITFRLAFGHNGAGANHHLKYMFFDDIVVMGSVIPVFELQVLDSIAYEGDPDLIALFRISRERTNQITPVHFRFGESSPTNGEATFGVDYTASASSPLVFTQGQATADITIHPVNNSYIEGPTGITWAEPPETITLILLSNVNYVIGGTNNGVAVLYDDDLPDLPVCFLDTFDTPASSNYWTVLTGGDTSVVATVEFAYDYQTNGIPPAPGLTDNYGLKLSFNGVATNQQAVVNLFCLPPPCSTNKYALSFDLYLQYNATNSLLRHALAGINANPTNVNRVRFLSPPVVEGEGQFVTLLGNDASSGAVGRAHLWDPDVASTNVYLDHFPPGSTANQLLNNPPYGANGGSRGFPGCDVNSTNKTWLQCQLIQLGDFVRFTINGYPVLETTITNSNDNLLGLSQTEDVSAASLGFGAIMLGYLSKYYSISDPDHMCVFDNVTLIDLESVAFTSLATKGGNVFFNFYSHLSEGYASGDFTILESADLRSPFSEVLSPAIIWSIHEDIAAGEAYFGAAVSGFSTTNSRFFTIEGP